MIKLKQEEEIDSKKIFLRNKTKNLDSIPNAFLFKLCINWEN